jgi:hypothetical protein
MIMIVKTISVDFITDSRHDANTSSSVILHAYNNCYGIPLLGRSVDYENTLFNAFLMLYTIVEVSECFLCECLYFRRVIRRRRRPPDCPVT